MFLADRLYRFHSLPHAGQVKSPLGELRALARDQWELQLDPSGAWATFSRGAGAGVSFKLYLSPHPADLVVVVRRALPVLSAVGAGEIKVGARPSTLLRSDRCVAYFSSLDALQTAGRELDRRLRYVAPLGVPFSGPLDRRGLLSWGFDPAGQGSSARSWREHVTECVARAMHRATRRRCPPIPAALRELELAGVDPETFAPQPSFLKQHAGGNSRR